ncbi:MAG: hypothetical protein K2X99_00935 [Gemmatimonadaceae bacterium]|nr:hypothetical protein [Gemmatimonadaceae bacterium]
MMRILTRSLLTLALATSSAAAQYFGQNQVQFTRFDWRVLKTEHFDVHYYGDLAPMARITGRMAERSYARLSKLMNWEFRERKPILLFASRGDFAQNNVTGDLGEGTGGVTDALRQRNMFFAGTDMEGAERVLTHEMVHVFQYDVFSSGRAGQGLQQLAERQPLWFIEGMAEYFSIGPDHKATDAVIRDAAVNGKLPTMVQLTNRPDLFFPYRFGEMVWRYVGERWGDELVGEIMQSTPALGADRAFKKHTGFTLEEFGDEWKEAMQTRFLPAIGELERPRKISSALLNARKTGGIIPVYVAPALSPDGKNIAYISTGNLLRAEVFLDLYLADATTGKRLKRLTKSTLSPEFEELRYAYSQSAFSPDGRILAFTAQRQGKDVLYLLDVRTRNIVRRLDTDLKGMIGPSWSPDGRRLIFSGSKGGISDLYMIDADGKNLRRLTNDVYGDLMPQWSPDGRRVAFVSERGPQSDLDRLNFGGWRIAVLDLESTEIEVLPNQAGKSLNPMWSPDGSAIAYISDRTGIAQIFLYEFGNKEQYQLTRLVGGVQSMTENSPAITWARQADRLAYTYFDDGDYTIWSIPNPRGLKREPYRDPVKNPLPIVVATSGDSAMRAQSRAAARLAELARTSMGRDTALVSRRDDPRRRSLYRAPTGTRAADELPASGLPGSPTAISVAALKADAVSALPNAESFKDAPYQSQLRPEAVVRPQIGYAQDNFGQGVFGGSGIVLGDLLGNRRLTIAGAVNGRIDEAQAFVGYTSLARRFQYSLGAQQQPFFFLNGNSIQADGSGAVIETQAIGRFIMRSAFAAGFYPLNKFTRFEYGVTFNNIDRSVMYISRGVDYNRGFATGFYVDSINGIGSLNYAAPSVAYVSDNALNGATGPIYGHRYRLELERNQGTFSWTNYNADLRRYDALIFSLFTLATRFQANISVGPGESAFPKWIGRADFIRGYDRTQYQGVCLQGRSGQVSCSSEQLLGSRTMWANTELRFPLVRRFELGALPIALPPVDALFFYDAGMAWTQGQSISLRRPADYDWTLQRYPLRSYGFGLRMNLFGIAILRWDYAVPRDGLNRKGYWFWTLGPSF